MDVNLIAYAVPVFLGLIGIELLVCHWFGKHTYRFNDAVTDISCGIGQQVVGVFLKSTLFVGYVYVYERFALFDLSTRDLAAWTVAFFGVDFFYYWWHRASHRVNILWAIHVVHHQSEEYNLAVALRQAWFSSLSSWVFFLPLAVVGVPPLVGVAMVSLNTLYQFWIHTRMIGKLGPLEWILNTPSHHRVHHGRNPTYVDTNYGGTLISWDRLFGTFREEEEEPIYGTVKPYSSWNPVWANFDYWVALAQDARKMPRWADAFKVWFMYPGWKPRGQGPSSPLPEASQEPAIRYDTESIPGINRYIALQFATIVAAMTVFMLHSQALPVLERGGAAALMVMTLLVWGGLLERKAWSLPLELGRLAILMVGMGWYALESAFWWQILISAELILIFFAVWILQYRSYFLPGQEEAVAV